MQLPVNLSSTGSYVQHQSSNHLSSTCTHIIIAALKQADGRNIRVKNKLTEGSAAAAFLSPCLSSWEGWEAASSSELVDSGMEDDLSA
mmetsp:Transcript_11397/g.26839  ORF Transcript_11397/g.26839 Transcript_11397/m.26839 type:complete len:88 (-) Transcript_11397:71-334(-)